MPGIALICGISGQDGTYLAQLLLNKGYKIVGTSRDAQSTTFKNLFALGVLDQTTLESMVLTDFRSVLQTLSKTQPTEIYNLAGQSSVGLSFEQPVETLESISLGTLNLLEAIRFSGLPIKLYNACSSECYGDTGPEPADESTPFRPQSPYGVAKSAAFWQVANYREAYGLFACSGILFNHESPLRPERFVTRKIIAAACRIKAGRQEKLRVGNTDINRDWGWAPEYVEAMWKMLQQQSAEDFVVATGATYSLRDFIAESFSMLDLDWRDHVESCNTEFRKTDIISSHANPQKAKEKLNWQAKHKMPDVIKMMISAETNSK